MNRAARRHLLSVLSDAPLLVATVPLSPRSSHAAEVFLSSMGVRGWFVVSLRSLPMLPRPVRVVRGRRT